MPYAVRVPDLSEKGYMFVCPGHGNAVFLPDLPTVYRALPFDEVQETAVPFPYPEGI